tara:strand:- start:2995 stop:3585 length:591 start_codon:yes stop_codon:yes gene_type:complete
MINPAKVTNYNRSHVELEEFILFAINVAGKKSAIEAPKLDRFLTALKDLYGNLCEHADSPFSLIRYAWAEGRLMELMKEYSISPYKQRYNSYIDVMMISDLYAVSLNRLLQVRGIGLKTARFFLSHSREDFDEPMLDTHILHFLRDQGYANAPKTTPTNPSVYHQFASIFKDIARQLGKSVTDLDLEVWKKYSGTA